jgi:hypothetical protein
MPVQMQFVEHGVFVDRCDNPIFTRPFLGLTLEETDTYEDEGEPTHVLLDGALIPDGPILRVETFVAGRTGTDEKGAERVVSYVFDTSEETSLHIVDDLSALKFTIKTLERLRSEPELKDRIKAVLP